MGSTPIVRINRLAQRYCSYVSGTTLARCDAAGLPPWSSQVKDARLSIERFKGSNPLGGIGALV